MRYPNKVNDKTSIEAQGSGAMTEDMRSYPAEAMSKRYRLSAKITASKPKAGEGTLILEKYLLKSRP